MKKLLALLLALTLALSLGAVAFAAGEATTGSITINNTTAGETYLVYKVFDLTYASPVTTAADGSATTPVAYTYTAKGENDQFLKALNDGVAGANEEISSPFTLTETTTEGVYNVALKNGKTASHVAAFLTACEENKYLSNPAGEEKNGNGRALSFTGLDFGYYYITSSLGSAVTIDSTLPNVTVIDKNQEPTWDNEPEDPGEGEDTNPGKVIVLKDGTKTTVNSANYGDTVNFDIGVNATNTVNDEYVTYYYITDTISEGFTLPENFTPVVKVDGNTINNYTLYYDSNNAPRHFEIVIPWAEQTVTEGTVTAITSIYSGSTHEIHVTYGAIVNADGENVVIAGDGNPNEANFAYDSNKPGQTKEPPYDPDPEDPEDDPKKPYDENNKRTTTTYVYAVAIDKIDAETKAKLADAHFNIGNIIANQNTDGTYSFTKIAGENETPTDFVTDANGRILILGVKEGTYAVTETQAPSGYNKLTESSSVEASLVKSTTKEVISTTYYDEEGNVVETKEEADESKTVEVSFNAVSLSVENNSGVELPSTGGIGTTIFYVVGAVLVAGAAIVLFARKRAEE